MKIDWCMFGFHQYRNWRVENQGRIVNFDGVVTGSFRVLEATCKNCRKLKYKKTYL